MKGRKCWGWKKEREKVRKDVCFVIGEEKNDERVEKEIFFGELKDEKRGWWERKEKTRKGRN